MAKHIIANITWQENYWTGEPSSEDMKRAGHRHVSQGNVGHEYLNFDLEINVKDGYKIGFFQATRQPTRFSNGVGNVFFYSKGYIVGVYGQAEIGDFQLAETPDNYYQGNVRAPIDAVCRFSDIRLLKANPDRHFGGKARVGQIGFIYIDDDAARTILDDAIARHDEESEFTEKLEIIRARLDKISSGRSMWKIAPGENADLWEECIAHNCIAIGWPELGDFRQYKNEKEIKKALGVSAEDHSRNALTVWYFTNEISNGDIIVANKGRTTIVGIGIVTGGYLPPSDPRNPNLALPNIRPVDWKITEAVDISINLPIPTVMPIAGEQWQQIKRAYLSQNPALKEVFDEIEGETVSVVKDSALENVFKETRNVILYGPPGTGKTYRARRFAQAWTKGQVSETDTPQRNYWCVVANQIKEWHWDRLFNGETVEGFDHGNLKRNYQDIQPGDLVFGYLARPSKHIYCLAEVVLSPDPGTDDWAFYLKGVRKLTNPIPWQMLREDPVLQNSEPVRIKMRGTLFRFEPHEAEYLRELVEAENPELGDVFEDYWNTKRGEYVRMITFHQSYGYEDFIEGLRPIPDKQGQIRYEWRPGAFKQMCDEAIADPGSDFILIVDEINRGNIAKIFGELITLVEDDKRLGKNETEMAVILPGSQQRFGVPDNLYLLGTMNTADRSIALLDIALRRRFTFVELEPDPSLLAGREVEGIPLDALLIRLNARIEALLDRDHRLGHSYLMGIDDINRLHYVWYRKIIPLLEEYFYGDGVRLKAILDEFVEQDETAQNIFTNPPDTFDFESPSYRIVHLDGTQFVAALKKIIGSVRI